MSDAISRHGTSAWLENMGHPNLAKMVMDEKRFPPVMFEPKKGKWHKIDDVGLALCDCGYVTDRYSVYNFCPECGADMRQRKED